MKIDESIKYVYRNINGREYLLPEDEILEVIDGERENFSSAYVYISDGLGFRKISRGKTLEDLTEKFCDWQSGGEFHLAI